MACVNKSEITMRKHPRTHAYVCRICILYIHNAIIGENPVQVAVRISRLHDAF